MPHLSPLLWLFIPFMILTTLLYLSIFLWFFPTPFGPLGSNSQTPSYSPWLWV